MDTKHVCFIRYNRKTFLIFEKKIFRFMFGLSVEINIIEWKIRNNANIKELFQKSNIIYEIRKRRLFWTMLKNRLTYILGIIWQSRRKIPIRRPRLKWEVQVIKDMKPVIVDVDWRVLAIDRKRWYNIYLSVRSCKLTTKKKK